MKKIFSKKGWETFWDFAVITFGTFIVAAAVFFFLMPSKLSVGSGVGIAIVLAHFIPVPVSILTMGLNVFFLLIGFLLIGKEFGAKTVYASMLMPVFIRIFEQILPGYESILADPFLDMICYCLLVSIGLALLFARNASSGGLDIVAKILNKFFHMELGKAMSLAGICVALSSALAYDKKTVVLSIIGTYLNGIVLDNFIFGMNTKKRVCIISEKLEEIRNYLIHDLHSGATIYETLGAYDFQPHKEIVTIVNKAEYAKLMSFMSATDKEAFMTVYTVNEIMYKPKIIHTVSENETS
ncbi:MAG: YitT family protein [Clostridiales bacterium]|nr:YitT family protein [Clostridiales bacterium]